MSRPPSTPARRGVAPRHAAASLPQTPNASLAATSGLTALPPFSTTSTARLQALYSDFSRQKNSNPDAYASNVDWWRRALEVVVASGMQLQHPRAAGAVGTATPRRKGWASGDFDEEGLVNATSGSEAAHGDRLVLHAGRDLMESVKIPKVGKPLALGAVLSELRSTRTAYPLSEFLSSKASVYDPGWLPGRIAAYVVGRPLWWALHQMGIVSGSDGASSSSSSRTTDHTKDSGWWGMYVLLPLVEKAADEVVRIHEARMASPGDALYTLDSFRREFAGVLGDTEEQEESEDGAEERPPMRERDAEVLLKFLERDRGVLVVDKDIIKFVDKNAAPDERTITAVDRGILELKSAIRNLQMQVDVVQHKIDECTKKASAALQQKRKPVALSHLRARKQLEDLLNKRLGSLHTLESTYITVETAAGDIEIMKSYESSTATLRGILAHPSLARDNVDQTLEALAEANADAREMDDAVRMGGDVSTGVTDAVGVDEDELEAELRAMVKATEDEAEQARERAFVERAQKQREAVAAAKEREGERVEGGEKDEEARLQRRLDEIRRMQTAGKASALESRGQAQERGKVVEAS